MTRARRIVGARCTSSSEKKLLSPNHIKRMVVALGAEISAILWSAQDTKKKFPWYVAKYTSFQSRAAHPEKTTKSYRGLSVEAKMRYFLGGIKGRKLDVFLAVIHNDVAMKVDFSKASTYRLNCICNDKRVKKTHQISGVDQRQEGCGQGCGSGAAHGVGPLRDAVQRGKQRLEIG